MTGITVSRVGGTLLAVKRADTGGAARLRHEAEILRRVDHPGLVEVVGLDEGPPVELHTRFAGPESWDRRPPEGDQAIVAGLAAVAAIVADLHDVDTSHRALDPSHVIATAEDRPVLCGLGDAGPADDKGRRADMAGLADLVDALGATAGDDLRRHMAAVAAGCRQGTIDARVLARRLDAFEPRRASRVARVPRTVLVGCVAIGLAAAGTGGWMLTSDGSARAETPAEAAVGSAPPTTSTLVAATTLQPTTTTATTTTVPTAAAPSTPTTVDRVEAPDPASPARSGPEVVHEGRRYGVGHAGDVVVLGDWDCDGIVTPAALRTTAGTIAVFDTWPPPGEQLAAVHVLTVEDAESLDVETVGDCDTLRVRTTTGSMLLELPPAA